MTRKAILVCLLMLLAAVPSTGQQSGSAGVGQNRATAHGAPISRRWIDPSNPVTASGTSSTAPGKAHRDSGGSDECPAFPFLVEEAERQVRVIVEDLARDPNKGGRAGRQVGDFYASWMDTAAIEANGIGSAEAGTALEDRRGPEPGRSAEALPATPGYAAPVEVGIIPDPADPTRYVAVAGQGSLGLPTRDFYLLTGDRYDAIPRPIAHMS